MNNKFSGVDSSINDLRTITNSLIHNTVALYRPSEMRVSHDKANVKEFTTFEPDAVMPMQKILRMTKQIMLEIRVEQ